MLEGMRAFKTAEKTSPTRKRAAALLSSG